MNFLFIGGADLCATDWASCMADRENRGAPATAVDWTELPWSDGIEAVSQALAEKISAVHRPVVVAHSAAGLLVARSTQKVTPAGVIYLAALVAHPGLTFFEQMFECPIDVFDPRWLDQNRLPNAHTKTHETLYGHRFLPARPIAHPQAYLVCSADSVIRPAWQEWTARSLVQVTPQYLATGHLAPIENPLLLTQTLDHIVNNWNQPPGRPLP